MSVGSDSQSSSQILSSSQASLNQSSKRTSSEIPKIYKHASQLFLTRRLLESYDALQPIVTPPSRTKPDDSPAQAPIATATTSQRVKIWSLYVTLLNSIVDLGYEEGGKLFGQKEYDEIVRSVREGQIWEEVVRDGYQGREASVDAEVVYNLSTLLLGQAHNQILNQSRLETYLSSSHYDLDFSSQLNNAFSNGRQNGTNTPKDLASRIKILELFTLHVLPRNDEWDYARSFISNSDILDEERREAFLQTLQELQEVNEQDDDEPVEHDVFEDTEEELQTPQTIVSDEGHHSLPRPPLSRATSKHQRTSSEVDYGIEMDHPNGSHLTSKKDAKPSATQASKEVPMINVPPQPIASAAPPLTPPASSSVGRVPMSPPAHTPRRAGRKSKASNQNSMFAQARQLFLALSNLVHNLAGTLSKNPTSLLRSLLFILAFVMAFSQKQVRERARKLLNTSWAKVRGTVGMGTKVSYI
ncbi:hypothetical protein LTR10_019059 [Elasticomyces elasticus]|uniref:Peroxin 26 n=1 Tax=Exophiala sideris TaxID=1016849 RepID=A0A0D1YK13_9EURO|nr:hypothetical protein LTR10_019059 [Elasticomyces elasticus]KAK5022945.1 hypothetical protein LTS07_009673 [Exophiala sideris]KAK5177338.1 hypothetical protein LTR44_010133 [Eurotiomycetes sp. CCFEE 6388]KAK5026376.1 hypothetical protein LTR13_009990 [Exophiala sideris]KAK5052310.1 hypothetical protein LTR69_009846 [Exophiala sideris]